MSEYPQPAVPARPDAPAGTTLTTRYILVNAAEVDEDLWADLNPVRIVSDSRQHQAALFPVLVDSHALDDAQRASLPERIDT